MKRKPVNPDEERAARAKIIVDDLVSRGFVTRVCGDDSVVRTTIENALKTEVVLARRDRDRARRAKKDGR